MRVHGGECEVGETVAIGRHGRAWEIAFRSGRNGHMLVRLLKEKLFVLLDGHQNLTGGDILLFSASFVAVNVTPILVLNFSALCSQCRALLFSSLLRSKALGVGGYETVVLLVEPGLTLLKTLPLLEGSRDIGLHTLHLSLNLLLGLVEFASNGVFVVTLLLPLCLLGCRLFSLILGNASQVFCLNGELGGRVFSLDARATVSAFSTSWTKANFEVRSMATYRYRLRRSPLAVCSLGRCLMSMCTKPRS